MRFENVIQQLREYYVPVKGGASDMNEPRYKNKKLKKSIKAKGKGQDPLKPGDGIFTKTIKIS